MKIQFYGMPVLSESSRLDERRTTVSGPSSHAALITLSSEARSLEEAREMTNPADRIRPEAVAAAKAALADGSLFSDQALDVAVSRMMSELY